VRISNRDHDAKMCLPVSPVNPEMNRDPCGAEELADALWLSLICLCRRCGAYLELPEHDGLIDKSPMEWAALVAPLAKVQGWSAPDDCSLECPECRKTGEAQ
jgi:hypothetical protein